MPFLEILLLLPTKQSIFCPSLLQKVSTQFHPDVYYCWFFLTECKCLPEIELIEAKCVSEIELIKAKCLSEAEIIELIEAKLIEAQDDCRDNPCQNGDCIDLENDYKCNCNPGFSGKNCDATCPLDNPLYREVDGVCLR